MRWVGLVSGLLLFAMTGQLCIARGAGAESKAFVGVDLGVAEPFNNNFCAHVENGGTANPFVGYMFNDYLGVQGQLHLTFFEPGNDHRGFARESQISTLLGGTAGPRLNIPVWIAELYATAQGGYFTGLSGRLTQSAPGVSLGGGIDFNLTPKFSVGAFGRWNRVYMSPRPTDLGPLQDPTERFGEDIRFVTGGIGLKYTFTWAQPPPPPPPVVAVPTPVKKVIVLRSVHFDFDKATLRPDAIEILNEAVEILKQEGEVTIIVEGHADSIGTESYNLKLSERRAASVRRYLVDHGISADRITTSGLGESRPIATNETPEGRAQNRRVEIHVK